MGQCPYKDFLDQGREGFNHVGIRIDDIDPYIAEFKTRGIGILFSGDTERGGKFAYLDTEKTFGMIIELIQPPKT